MSKMTRAEASDYLHDMLNGLKAGHLRIECANPHIQKEYTAQWFERYAEAIRTVLGESNDSRQSNG